MNFTRKIIICLIVIIAAGVMTPCLGSESYGTILSTKKLEKIFIQLITSDSPFPSEDLVITNFSSRPSRLELPSGSIDYLAEMGTMTGRVGLRTFVLKILVDGTLQAKVKMSGSLLLYGNVISAAKSLRRGKILTRDDFFVTRKNITMLGTKLIQDPDQILGKQLKATLRPGAIIFDSLVKSPQIIKRGDMVQIVAENPRIHVAVKGQARSAGALGDIIKVKNMMSRRQIYARIVDHDKVEVDF